MSILGAILNNSADSLQQAFRAADITSKRMRGAIDEWFRLYFQNEATDEEDPCQQIPYTIVHKLTKTAFSEYQATGKDEFTQGVLRELDKKRKKAMQMALIGGESLIKPVPTKVGFRFTVVNRANVLVFGRDSDGNMTDIGTSEQTVKGAYYYNLLERRMVDTGGHLVIRNYLYRSRTQDTLGQQVGLNSLPEYADLPQEYTFSRPVGAVGLMPLRTPMENCVDGSEDAVSVYAAAVGLIHNINRNEAQLNGEFKRGESRIITSADMLKRDKHGRRTFDEHLFVGLDEDLETTGVTIFSPELREKSFLARKQDYLRSAESIIGLKRGLLSEVEATERTAKEITSSEGDYNLTIIDFQQMWEDAVKEALRLCGILGQLYRIPGAHEAVDGQAAISWGNGILFDEEKTRQRMLSEVQAGLLQPERYMGFTYKLPCDTAAQRAKIRKDYMPDVLDDEGGEE